MTDSFAELALSLLSGVTPVAVFIALYFGLVIGSFLNVVIYRLPMQRSVVLPNSGCGSCGVPLRWSNNIPVFSYLWQRGLCSYCGAPFSPRYMLIELSCGVAAVAFLLYLGTLGWAWLFHFTLFAIALAVFFTDLDHWIIPDEINLFGVVVGTLLGSQMPVRGDMEIFHEVFGVGWPWAMGNVASSLMGIAVSFTFFKFIQVLGLLVARQEAMGEGDVKYAMVLGAFLGWQMALAAFFLSFLLGALFALPLLLASKGKGKDPIPFGTFMSLAAVPVALWGDWLWAQLALFETI